MNKLTTNGTLIVDTIEIAERTGRFDLVIAIDGYSENYNYYAEFETANLCKTMSGPIVPITGGGGYVIAVPTAVSHYVGDVFMQIVSYSRASGELISRSLVSNRAAFCVVKSILAEESIPNKEKDDYMARLEKLLLDNEKVLCKFDSRLEKQLADNETVQVEFGNKLAQLDSKLVEKSSELSGSIALVDTKADINTVAISVHRTATRLAPVVIYDRSTKNNLNNTTYDKVLPQTMTIDLSSYKMLSFYMQYYEYQIVLEARNYDPYNNIIRAGGHFAGVGNADEFNCEVEYNRATKVLKYKLISKKYTNGNFAYVNIVMDTIYAGLTRIEGCVNSI